MGRGEKVGGSLLTGCPLSVSIHPICPGEQGKALLSPLYPGMFSPGPSAASALGAGMLFHSKCDSAVKYLLGVTFMCHSAQDAAFRLRLVVCHGGEMASPIYRVN